jgi:hypothetical protein
MNQKIIIVGTNHEYQWADKCRSHDEIEKFRRYITHLATKYSVLAIAEEMSIEALNTNDRDESIPFQVTRSLKIEHQYSDPNLGEQSNLEIMNEGTIEFWGMQNNWSKKEKGRRVQLEYRKREAVWITKIKGLNTWPLLFICGSEHVIPLYDELLKLEYAVKIEAQNWTA